MRYHYEVSITKNGVVLRRLVSDCELFSFREAYDRLMQLMFHPAHQDIFNVEYCQFENNVAVFIWASVDNA